MRGLVCRVDEFLLRPQLGSDGLATALIHQGVQHCERHLQAHMAAMSGRHQAANSASVLVAPS